MPSLRSSVSTARYATRLLPRTNRGRWLIIGVAFIIMPLLVWKAAVITFWLFLPFLIVWGSVRIIIYGTRAGWRRSRRW